MASTVHIPSSIFPQEILTVIFEDFQETASARQRLDLAHVASWTRRPYLPPALLIVLASDREVPPPMANLDCVRYVVQEPQIEEFRRVVNAFNQVFIFGKEIVPYLMFGGIERAQVDLLPSNTLRRAVKGILRTLPLRTVAIFTPDGASHNFVQFLRGGNKYVDVLELGLGMPPTPEAESEDEGEGGVQEENEDIGGEGDPVREDAGVRGSVEPREDAGSEDVGSEDVASENSEAESEGDESEDDYLEDLHRIPLVSLSYTDGFFAALGEYTLLQTVVIWTNARLFHDMGPLRSAGVLDRPLRLVNQLGECIPTLLDVYLAYNHSHATSSGRWNSRERDHYSRALGGVGDGWSRKAWELNEEVEGAIW